MGITCLFFAAAGNFYPEPINHEGRRAFATDSGGIKIGGTVTYTTHSWDSDNYATGNKSKACQDVGSFVGQEC